MLLLLEVPFRNGYLQIGKDSLVRLYSCNFKCDNSIILLVVVYSIVSSYIKSLISYRIINISDNINDNNPLVIGNEEMNNEEMNIEEDDYDDYDDYNNEEMNNEEVNNNDEDIEKERYYALKILTSDPTSITFEEQTMNKKKLDIHNKHNTKCIHVKKHSCKNIPSLHVKSCNSLESVVVETESFTDTPVLNIDSMIILIS